MKKWILAVVLTVLVGCGTDTTDNGITISVLHDRTEDHFIARPTVDAITPLFPFGDDLWKGATFRYGEITGLNFNRRREVSIDNENSLLGNELERRQAISDFLVSVSKILNDTTAIAKQKESSIWRPIVEELKVLGRGSIQGSQLFVFSDLKENTSDGFSFYRPKDRKLLQNTPEKVVKTYLEMAEGVAASGNTRVTVVYQPHDTDDDKEYLLMVGLYKAVFKRLGIPIEFKTSIQTL